MKNIILYIKYLIYSTVIVELYGKDIIYDALIYVLL